jgi:hypothetical protein
MIGINEFECKNKPPFYLSFSNILNNLSFEEIHSFGLPIEGNQSEESRGGI